MGSRYLPDKLALHISIESNNDYLQLENTRERNDYIDIKLPALQCSLTPLRTLWNEIFDGISLCRATG
jgi:hypothetical protein